MPSVDGKPAAASGKRLPGWRWKICALLFAATLLNYLDRQTLSVSAPLVRAEMGLDLEQLGLLFSVFYWSYAAGQIFVGVFFDRFPVKYAYAAAVAAWSLVGAAAGLASGFASLLVLRALLGLCEAANWPAALRVVSRTFAPRERSLANGIFQSGTSVGALLAPPILIYLGHHYGWRMGFIALGLAGLVWVVFWLVAFRETDSPTGNAARTESEPEAVGLASPEPPPSVTVAQLLRSRALWGLVVASSFVNPCLYFYVNWLPTYFVESGQSFGGALAGTLLVTYLVLDVGYITGGLLIVRLTRRMELGAARRRLMTIGTVLMCGIVTVSQLSHVYAATAVIALAALGLGWFMVNYLAFVQDVSHERVSTVAGILGAAGSVSGAIVMWVVGALSKAGGFALPFVMIGVMPLVALAGIWIGTTPRRHPMGTVVAGTEEKP